MWQILLANEKIEAPRHWPLCGEFTGTGEFPTQRASYAENVSIWWRHHGMWFKWSDRNFWQTKNISNGEMNGWTDHYRHVTMSVMAQIIGVSIFAQPFVQAQIKENIKARHKGFDLRSSVKCVRLYTLGQMVLEFYLHRAVRQHVSTFQTKCPVQHKNLLLGKIIYVLSNYPRSRMSTLQCCTWLGINASFIRNSLHIFIYSMSFFN